MSFQFERGLFRLDFTDHHAILGVPVDAEIKDIRKRYLKIARRLHPDSHSAESEAEKQFASQLLSRLVNPAWEKLSQERDRTEYSLMLKLKGQQASHQQAALEVGGLAKQLSEASNLDHTYLASLKSLADKQYDQLDQTSEIIAQISELNMVYLMRKEAKGETLSAPKQRIFTGSNIPDSSQAPNQASAPPAPTTTRRESLVNQYYRRAEASAAKNNFSQAILELRDALQVEPNNSSCHSLMGMVYLKQKQVTMAKIHFNKALQLNPQDPMAIEGKQLLEKVQATTGKTGTSTGKAAKATPGANKPNNDKPGGGLFGLFGGKKK